MLQPAPDAASAFLFVRWTPSIWLAALAGRPMPEQRRFHHISSAVVSVKPAAAARVMAQIAAMPETEIRAHHTGRVVIVLEGTSAGDLGARLAALADIEGVISANMVFEHIEELEAVEQ
jgi:periplasmic nitrate reductase NapD